ncbi:uncharacterized protein EV422DRAFT_73802 [Fimicolochytrium jonesii]|uniref:uncharacterized protein n=1 Tax=Fimicolochytrium jonesii TaxID=1396493 RepID=UPI0022FE0647|nr:uncharacterized protein EV422DRAFT_73802 [Fimicolochytrium jonesii]KAI8820514.1 hypothetical protein EV422DRAFT_73802 [Fimicolochytrium jonesii]
MSSYRAPQSSGMTVPVCSQPVLARASVGRNPTMNNLSDKHTPFEKLSSPVSQKLTLDELAAKSEQLALAKGIRVSSSRGTRSNTTAVEQPLSTSHQQRSHPQQNVRSYQPPPPQQQQQQTPSVPRHQQHPDQTRVVPPQIRGNVPSFHYWMPVPALLHGAKLPPDQRKSLEAAYGRVTPPFPQMIPTAHYLMSRRVSAPNCLTVAPPPARGSELQPRDGMYATNPQHGPVRMGRPVQRSAQTHQAAGGSYGRYSTSYPYPMHMPSAKQQVSQYSVTQFSGPRLQTLSTPAAPAAENPNLQASRRLSTFIKKPHAKGGYVASHPMASPPTPVHSTTASHQRSKDQYAQAYQAAATRAQRPVKTASHQPPAHKTSAQATTQKSTIIETIPCPIERLDVTETDEKWRIDAQFSPRFARDDIFVIVVEGQDSSLRPKSSREPAHKPSEAVSSSVAAAPSEVANLAIYMEAMRIENQADGKKDVYSSQTSVSLGTAPGIVGSLAVSDVVNGRLTVTVDKAVL